MDAHALDILEFPLLLQGMATYACSEPGRAWVLKLRPQRSVERVRPYRELFSALLETLGTGTDRPELSVPDAADVLRRAAPSNAVLAGEDLVKCRDLLRATSVACGFLGGEICSRHQALRRLRRGLRRCPSLLKRLEKTVDDQGRLLDSGSPVLSKLRKSERALAAQVQRRLEGLLRSSKLSEVFQEQFVTVRNGRFVVPVRRELRARIPGVVHDHSDSGRTLFVEPAQTLSLGNELADVRLHIRDECRRVLAELSDVVREHLPALRADLLRSGSVPVCVS